MNKAERQRIRRQLPENREKAKQRRKSQKTYFVDYREANREHIQKYKSNRRHQKSFWRPKHNKSQNKYRSTESFKIKRKNRLLTDPQYKLSNRMSLLIRKNLHGKKSGRSWESLVGYTAQELKQHLESLWRPDMSWANYGECWHIDHIIPESLWQYTSPEDSEFKQCWSLANLQPLWAIANMKKGNKTAYFIY